MNHKVIQTNIIKANLNYIPSTILDPRDLEKPETRSCNSGSSHFSRGIIILTINNLMDMNRIWFNVLWEDRSENTPFVDALSV